MLDAGWLPGKIVQTSELLTFQVQLEDGRDHTDHVRPRAVDDGGTEMSRVTFYNCVPVHSSPLAADTYV